MARFLLRRILSVVPTVLLATVVVFGLIQLVPGDLASVVAGETATPERLETIRQELHLNDPVIEQYGSWLNNAVHGDLGNSFATGEPVADSLQRRLPATLHIVMAALIVAIGFGLPMGVISAVHARTRRDSIISTFSTMGIAIPNFWLAMVLVTLFSLNLGWLPAIGYVGITDNLGEAFRHLILPAVTLGAAGAAEVARQVRSAMVEVLSSDAMRTHRAKGLPMRSIVWRHALRNAGVPIATVLGLLVGRLMSATVIVEAVFGIPGVGTLVVQAAQQRDFPVIQGVVLVMILMVLATNLIVDLAYRFIDPRVKY